MSHKISRSFTTTNLTIYGINPHDYSGIKTMDYVYLADYSKSSEKEKENLKRQLTHEDFIPAQIVPNETKEDKYSMDIEKFVSLSYVVNENGKTNDMITKTVITNKIRIYGINPDDLKTVYDYEITYYGDFSKLSVIDKQRLMYQAESTTFYPAYLKLESITEEKRAITINDFITNSDKE